ncbi:hypothetical protein V8C44DRAFT_350244 [Trichoderma aethiopicum]
MTGGRLCSLVRSLYSSIRAERRIQGRGIDPRGCLCSLDVPPGGAWNGRQQRVFLRLGRLVRMLANDGCWIMQGPERYQVRARREMFGSVSRVFFLPPGNRKHSADVRLILAQRPGCVKGRRGVKKDQTAVSELMK